jgi:small-conductance mechanosensitive channel
MVLLLSSLLFPLLWTTGLYFSILISLQFDWPNSLIWIAVNLLIAWIGVRLISVIIRDAFWARTITVIAFALAVLNIVGLLAPMAEFLDGMAVDFGQIRVSLLTVIQGMLYFGILLWIAVLISRLLEQRIRQVPNLTPSFQVLIGKLFKASLIAIACLVSLTSIGIDLTALAVFSGAVGVGVGFGLQKVVSNLLSGIILLMDRSIKPGDIIVIQQAYGWVTSLGARYVAVQTRDGMEYLIPNEDIIPQQVVNWSREHDRARLKVQVRLAYDADVERALALMKEAAGRVPRVLEKPAPNPLLLNFGESCFELELRFWIRDVQNGIKNVSSQVMLEILRLFRENDIHLPYPQRDIHIRHWPGPPDTAPDGERRT